MITTIYGDERDESQYEKRTGNHEDDRAITEWVEYWEGDTLVLRSVHIKLKPGSALNIEQGEFH